MLGRGGRDPACCLPFWPGLGLRQPHRMRKLTALRSLSVATDSNANCKCKNVSDGDRHGRCLAVRLGGIAVRLAPSIIVDGELHAEPRRRKPSHRLYLRLDAHLSASTHAPRS